MKIRFKILAGFLLLVFLLIIAGLMSVYEFTRIGNKVNALIDNNYKSIDACRSMLSAVETEDNGLLLLIEGHWQESIKTLNKADSNFTEALKIAKNNLTIEDEKNYTDRIAMVYDNFKSKWELVTVESEVSSENKVYYTLFHDDLKKLRLNIEALRNLNQDSMHEEAKLLSQQSERAIMPGIVAIVSALVFLFIFNFFISRFFVRPVEKLINALKSYNNMTIDFESNLATHDELKELEIEIQRVITKLKPRNEK